VRTIRGLVLCVCAVLACAVAGAARGGLDVGVTEDAGKGSSGAAFFATLQDIGLTVNRVAVNWNPATPATIPLLDEMQGWIPQAQASGTRIAFAVAPLGATDLFSPSAKAQFVAFVGQLARAFPTVKDYVIGNEPNVNYFWQPQFNGKGTALSAAAYEPVLAASYDALKAVDPANTVIGVGLSPRGNDNPRATSNPSRSPVRYLHDLGAVYRASRRTTPLMDELGFHPYPSRNTDSPTLGYTWPNAGLPNLGRIKQGFWDAFRRTAQPTFAEPGNKFARPLRLDLDEVGWQVAPLPALAGLYFGVETDKPVSEQTQANYYRSVITSTECDPSVRMLSLFHLVDEPNLDRWQSGLERADGSHRAAYDAVKNTIARTHGNCQGRRVRWRHATAVVLPVAAWGNLRKPQPGRRTGWSFKAGAGEEATFRAGIFKAGLKKGVLARLLASGRPRPLLFSRGRIEARTRVVRFPRRRLEPGKYVYAIRMSATMNPVRVSILVSRAFRVARAHR
jgi:hypothetical protein